MFILAFFMGVKVNTNPKVLEHDLNQYFPELLKFDSIEETQKSDVYRVIKDRVERILNAVVQEDFAPAGGHQNTETSYGEKKHVEAGL